MDKESKIIKLILFLIIFLAFFLRFWKLDSYPALNADEAAIGYNVYSLLESGKDEHGNPWPVHFQSFNDYKPGLYFYLSLPFVKVFGLNEWSVRAPGAFLGVATIYLIYLLVNELLAKQKNLQPKSFNQALGLISAFFLAISPWHIHFSRGGWEANVATFFIILGIYLFLKALRNLDLILFELSFLFFALSLYTYHAARVVVPLLFLGLLAIYGKEVKKNLKNFFFASLVGLLAVLPLVKDFTKSEITSRAAGVGLFADTGPLARINEQRGEHINYLSLEAKLLHNKLINYGLAFLENWADHFHGEFLFLSGDGIQRNKVPETGQMYLFDIPLLIIGTAAMVKNLLSKRGVNSFHPSGVKLILWWLFVAPTASALTFQSPHALRAQNMVIPLTIISSLGFYSILGWLGGVGLVEPRRMKAMSPLRCDCIYTLGIGVLLALMAWNFARYLHMYWVHMAKEYPYSSQYGVKELVSYVKENQDKYQKIIVTDKYDQPYILFLFYLKYAPKKFQGQQVLTPRDRFGFSTVSSFDKYEFKPIVWDTDQPSNPNSLIIGTDEEIPDEANIVKEIYGTNGYKYFEIVAN